MSDDRKRFEEEQRRQAEAVGKLERSFLQALTDWLAGIAKTFIQSAVHGIWDWLKNLVSRR